mgnify:CR=1 FL=1
MPLCSSIRSKYAVVAYGRPPDFAEPFEVTKKVSDFLEEFELGDDVEIVTEAKVLTDKERHAQQMAEQNKGQKPGRVITDKERHEQNKGGGSGKILTDRDRAKQKAGDGGGGKPLSDKQRLQQNQQKDSRLKTAPEVKHMTHDGPKKHQFLTFPIGTMVRLKDSVQKDLARTYRNFVSNDEAGNKLHKVEQGIIKQVNDLIKKVAKREKIEPRGIHVAVDIDSNSSDHTSGTITIKYKGQEKEIEPRGLHYTDNGGDFSDAMMSYNWAAWLGHDNSPFESSTWVDAYNEMEAANWFEQAGDIEEAEDEILEAIEELLTGHENADQKEAAYEYKRRAGR